MCRKYANDSGCIGGVDIEAETLKDGAVDVRIFVPDIIHVDNLNRNT
jgi:hypothetical protein